MTIDVKDIKEIYQSDKTNWSDAYDNAKSDIAFLSPGGQWEDAARNSRTSAKLPALEIDQLTQYVHQVVNDFRMNTPSINIIPVDDKADIETAKAYKGLIRRIEYASAANVAYDTAMEYAVKCSIGFVRVDHQYSSPESFEQELVIKRVVNPFSVTLDSNIVECDGRDAMHGTIFDSYSKKAFEAQWPGAKFISFDGDGKHEAKNDETINIAEFFKVEETEVKKALMQSGDIMDWQKGMDGVKNVRSFKKRKVYRCKLSGEEELESTYFPGIYVPIVPFFGEECWKDGKRETYSLIRRSKDAQRRFNVWASKEMEILLKAPTAPVVAVAGQLAGFENEWKNPEGASVLQYHNKDSDGQPLDRPERLSPPQIPTGIINAMQGAGEQIKSTLGMYDASVGNRSNEVSGVAIENRQRKGDVATFHFGDNGVRSITHIGRICVSAIPEVYDTERVITIMGEEDEPKMAGINGHVVDGQKETFNLAQGAYDVRVTTGPSYTTKRQEANALMTEVVAKQPELMGVIGDLVFKYSDVAGAEAIAARIKKTIPPQLLEPEDGEKEIPPEVIQAQQQVQQAQQAMEQMKMDMTDLAQQLDQMKVQSMNKQGDLQLKAQENAHKAQVDQANLELKAAELELKAREMDMREKETVLQHMSAPAKEQPEVEGMDIGTLEQLLEGKKQEKVKADADAQAQIGQQMEVERQRIAEREQDIQLKQAAMQQSQFLAEQIIGAIGQLTQAIQTPKEVVRDDQGRVMGVH